MADLLTDDQKALVTLIETVKNLGKNQDDFRLEVKQGFDELKNNWNNRLAKVEDGLANTDKVFIAKNEQDRRDAMFNTRVSKLEVFYQRIMGALIIINILLSLLIAYWRK